MSCLSMTVVNIHQQCLTFDLSSQDAALLPFVFFSTFVSELENGLTLVSGSPGEWKDGNIANFETWDE